MFQRILVPVDDTWRSDEALQVARHLAERTGAGLILLGAGLNVAHPHELARISAALGQEAEQLRAQGVQVEFVLRLDRIEEGISAAATQHAADLIVVAPEYGHTISAEEPWGPGSHLLTQSPAPLLVWPERLHGETPDTFLSLSGSIVLVPLDGSAQAEQAIPIAIALAREYGRQLVLVQVVMPVPLSGAGTEAHRWKRQAQKQEETRARNYLGSVRQRIARDAHVTAQTMVVWGKPAAGILRIAEAHRGSLIVMATRGGRSSDQSSAGSVAVSVLRQSPVPILLMPLRVISRQLPGEVSGSATAASAPL